MVMHLFQVTIILGLLVPITTDNLWSNLIPETVLAEVFISQAPSGGTNGEPLNKSRGGGGLNGSETCRLATTKLTILVPTQNPTFATMEQSTIWAYVPYGAADVEKLEFTLNQYDKDDVETFLYRDKIALPATPGIVGIRLPASLVQTGKRYRWYLELYCQGNEDEDGPNESVNAGLRQIVPGSPDALKANPPGHWYDRVTTLARQRLAKPNNSQLQHQWVELLKSIGQEDIVQKPLIGEIELPLHSSQ